LLSKLDRYGFRGQVNDWFKNYLKNKSQVVNIINNVSHPKSIVHGVPQGSTLGPLLFLVYINNIFDNLNSEFILYADDDTIIIPTKSLDELFDKANSSLQILSEALLNYKLIIT